MCHFNKLRKTKRQVRIKETHWKRGRFDATISTISMAMVNSRKNPFLFFLRLPTLRKKSPNQLHYLPGHFRKSTTSFTIQALQDYTFPLSSEPQSKSFFSSLHSLSHYNLRLVAVFDDEPSPPRISPCLGLALRSRLENSKWHFESKWYTPDGYYGPTTFH
jgi:hypothetical protein